MRKRISEPVLLGAAFVGALLLIVARAHRPENDAPALIQEAFVPFSDREGQLLAVVETDSDVLAIDGADFLHAVRSEKRWRPVNVPQDLPRGGRFAIPRSGAKRLFYYPVRSDDVMVIADPKSVARFVSGSEARELSGKTPGGLYVTDPTGSFWERVNEIYDFEQILETAGGRLYALASTHDAPQRQDRILRSTDGGRTWDDVTHNALALGVGRAIGLKFDPARPELVCIEFQGMRGYIVSTQDERHVWTAEREKSWVERNPSTRDFFSPNFFYSGIDNISDYQLFATRANYFLFPFGNRLALEPFELALDRAEYEFSRSAPKFVTATLRFRRSDHAAAIMDLKSSTDFWGLKVEDSEGQRVTIRPQAEHKAMAGATQEEYFRTQAEYEKLPGLVKAELVPGRAYRRTVDLTKLYTFPKPGAYTVQLTYSCPFWAGEGRVHWNGGFGGLAVKVVIR